MGISNRRFQQQAPKNNAPTALRWVKSCVMMYLDVGIVLRTLSNVAAVGRPQLAKSITVTNDTKFTSNRPLYVRAAGHSHHNLAECF